MMRYDIEETAVYIQVRTVVWEDGVARPLLPDSRRLKTWLKAGLFALEPRRPALP